MNEEQEQMFKQEMERVLNDAIIDRRQTIYRLVLAFLGIIANGIIIGRYFYDKVIIICGALTLGAFSLAITCMLEKISICNKIIKDLGGREK